MAETDKFVKGKGGFYETKAKLCLKQGNGQEFRCCNPP